MKAIFLKFIIYCFVFFLFNSISKAQLIIDAQLRNRFEIRNGYKILFPEGAVPSVFISQRTRINFNYKSEKLKIQITPQDVRVWGDEQLSGSTGVFGDDASLSLFEGYADIKIVQLGWLAVGRQQLVYDNQRLLAGRNWNQNGLAYDAAVLKLELNSWNLHAGGSWNSTTESSTDNLYPINRLKSLNFLWLNKTFEKKLELSLLHLSTGLTQTDSTNNLNFRHTTGFYSQYKNENLTTWGNAYFQYGKNQSGKNVSAFLFDVDASYKIEKLIIGLGLGYLSGNTKTGNDQNTDHLFDVLYGARHKYFGSIDYFSSFASNTKQGGLADYYFYLEYKFSKSFGILNTSHYFQLAQNNLTTPENKNLGFENDLLLKFKFNSWGAFESGFSFFLPTQSLKTLQKVSSNKFSHFLYLQLTITPKLL